MIEIVNYKSEKYKQILELRNRILREPLGMNIYDDPLDEEINDIHFGYFLNNKVIGTLILSNIGNNTFKMRQVAVSKEAQGKGIGSKMVEFCENYAIKNGFTAIELNARDVAINFYEKQAYNKVGEPFYEVSILHYKMIKII